VKLASELDHLLTRRRALGKGRWIGHAKQQSRDLGARHVAVIERIGDRPETARLRGHIDRQAVLRAHLLGENVAIARAPFVPAVLVRPHKHRDSANESAALIAGDAAFAERR
jgi:hypothetical protein